VAATASTTGAPAANPPSASPPTANPPPRNPFPNYTQMPRRVPIWAWHAGRALSVGLAVGECVLLIAAPARGLELWWKLAIPLLPLLWLCAPGLWRNLCPLAASNQTPRLLRFTRGLTIPGWYREYAPVIGMVAFILLVASRKPLLNTSGVATAALIGASLLGAFAGGLVFKGKSGWCSSICPLLPVQRIYGQTPFATVPNSHCQPCVGCTKNCYDFNPRVAYLADLYEDDRHYTGYRRFFVGCFPGLVYCYFTLPAHISAAADYGRFAVFIGVSAGSFFLAETLLKVTVNKITAVYGAVAISLFYFYAAQVLSGTLTGSQSTGWFVWGLRGVVWALAAVWLVRTWRKEAVFVEQATTPVPVRLSASALDAARAKQAGNPEVTFAPSGLRLVAKPGATLLELAESGEQTVEAGCRMGVCGADPVCVVSGMDNLSPISGDERATLERLGYAENTRMACCARVEGAVTIALAPERADAVAPKRVAGFVADPEVKRVVIVGNGIAGVTAADHVRRRHPDCRIDVVANEPYPLYNRMGIGRLVYGSSAMVGLQLLPDSWYEENDVTCWLNTFATKLDRERREIALGTGETLPYDRLILATGSDSFVPPIEGWGAPGTFVLRRAADAFAIRTYAQEHRAEHAVIAGGGLLGLEAAYALHKIGLHVTVLERSETLLSRQLDARAAEILRDYLEGLGLHIALASETAALRARQDDGQPAQRGETEHLGAIARPDQIVRLDQVELRDRRTLPADLFLLAAGIAPLVELARASGIAVGRGVIVDDELRTSDPDVFAVGDVAEHDGRVYGLWPAAVEQGEIAAENALGGQRSYHGTVPVAMLKVVGVDLLSIGRFQATDEDTAIALEDPDEHSYRKLVIADGRIAGAILIARQQDAPHVTAAVREAREVSALMPALERGDWDVLAERQEPVAV
jgi:NADPH-dependent 2,4-dienoyl-CoA reductase/sulfur reductase-like enzyme/ferredoxin